MVKINTDNPKLWKAETVSETDPTSEQQDLLNRMAEAQTQIDQYLDQYDEYLTDDQRAEMERLRATLKAEAAAIESGNYYDPTTGEYGDGIDYTSRDSLADLGSGWNGGIISNFDEDAAKLSPEDGEYMGTVEIEASGNPTDPTKLGFSIDDAFEAQIMGEGGTIEKVEVRSQGRDLVVTLIGKDAEGNEVRKSWIIKEGTVRPEPIIFNFTQMSHAVTVDASHMYRVSDGSYNSYYGTSPTTYWHLTAHNDTFYGSQSNDKVVGWEGNDYIDGMAGDDVIWGDGYSETGGEFGENDGRDTIRGGAGSDTLYGGGNIDTRFTSDNPTATNPEATYEFESIAKDAPDGIPDTTSWIDATGWTSYEKDGMVVMENDGTAGGGEINITMPEGYDMAFAEYSPDGASVIITFVGRDGEGKPHTFKMMLKDFNQSTIGFSPEYVSKLNFKGSGGDDIIDFHKLHLTNQVINIEGNEGNDIILGAQNAIDIEHEDLVESSASPSFLSNYANSEGVLYEDEDHPSGFIAEFDPSNPGEIVIHEDDDPETTPANPPVIQVAVPEGYEQSYIAYDNNNGPDLMLILYNPTTKETIVIRIEAETGIDYTGIIVGKKAASDFDTTGDSDASAEEKFVALAAPLPISLDPNDYTIDGGAGSDLMFGPTGTNFVADASDEVIEGSISDGGGLNNAPAEEAQTVEEVVEEEAE